jgi:hypothetical protein
MIESLQPEDALTISRYSIGKMEKQKARELRQSGLSTEAR